MNHNNLLFIHDCACAHILVMEFMLILEAKNSVKMCLFAIKYGHFWRVNMLCLDLAVVLCAGCFNSLFMLCFSRKHWRQRQRHTIMFHQFGIFPMCSRIVHSEWTTHTSGNQEIYWNRFFVLALLSAQIDTQKCMHIKHGI